MTESGGPELLELSMLVVGYEVVYVRQGSGEPSRPPLSGVRVEMSVKGATVEHHDDRPISRAVVSFSEGPFLPGSVGNLDAGQFHDIAIFARLPWADFAGFWAALHLDRVARLRCSMLRGTDDILSLELLSQGSLFPLFPVIQL